MNAAAEIRTARLAEVAAARRALKAAGIAASVKHGRGTVYTWLEVAVSGSYPAHYTEDWSRHIVHECPRCAAQYQDRERALAIVQAATGRTGEYQGKISVRSVDLN